MDWRTALCTMCFRGPEDKNSLNERGQRVNSSVILTVERCFISGEKNSLFLLQTFPLSHKGYLFSLSLCAYIYFMLFLSVFFFVFLSFYLCVSICVLLFFCVKSFISLCGLQSLPQAVFLSSRVLTSDTSAGALIATCTSCLGNASGCGCAGNPGCTSPAPAPLSASPLVGRLSCRLGPSARSHEAPWCVPGAGRSAGARFLAAGSWGVPFVRAAPACGRWAAADAGG